MEFHRAAAVMILLKNVRAQNVARHQVGRELHAVKFQVEQTAEGLDQRCLPDPRQAFEQNVPTAQNAGEHETMKFGPAQQNAVEFGQSPVRKLDRRVDFFGLEDRFYHMPYFICHMPYAIFHMKYGIWHMKIEDGELKTENAFYFDC